MGARTLQTELWTRAGISVSLEDAENFRTVFFQVYPEFKTWHTQLDRAITQQHGAIETRTLTGRRRLGVRTYRAAANTPVQGSAADGFKLALVWLYRDRATMPDASVIALIHDEVLIECPIEQADATAAWVKDHMEQAMSHVVNKQVEIKADVTICQDWAGTPLPEDAPMPGAGALTPA